jgi:hypothetical protein
LSGRRLFTAAIMVSLMAAPAGAQSLGDVSRQEEARRATTKKAVKTLTNSDLDPNAITQSAGAAPAEASCYMSKSLGRCVGVEELVAKSVAGVQTAQNAPFEQTYRAEAKSIRSQIEKSQNAIASLEAVIADQGRSPSDRKAAEQSLPAARQMLAGLEKQWEKLERAVGNQHLPHTWIETVPARTTKQ